MIHLHTLGDTLITVGEKEIRPSSPMIFAALLYLGVERGRRVPRAALQEMFFPDSDERSGSHSVRQLLYKLRQLGAPVLANASTVTVDPVSVIDACSMDGASSWTDSEAARASLGFAPEYAPAISDRFDRWLERQEATVATRLRATLAALLLDRKSRLDWLSVANIAHSLLAVDPLNEEATLALAEASAISGGKQKAISMLSTYEVETGSELRLAPSLLRRRISESLFSTDAETPKPNKFYGRSQELSALGRQVRHPQEQGGLIKVVVGDAGIGKSRLLEEVGRSLALEGIHPFVVRCRPHYAERPLSVFIELVPELLQSRGALGINPESLKQLRKLIHEDPKAQTTNDVDDDIGRSELLRRALSDLFDAVNSEQRFMLVLEDLHWCDQFSLAELKLLASQFPVPIVSSSRSIDCLKPHFGDLADVLRLAPLAPEYMTEIAANLLGEDAEPGTKEWCARVAAGNPLFLRMLCCHVLHTGTRTVPNDLTAIISSRLVLLPDVYLRAIQYVALLGPYCTLSSLQELLALPPSKFIDCIAHLDDKSYLSVRENGIGLNHDLVSEVALNLASPVTRRALHAHVASYLERRFEQSGNTAILWDCAEQLRLSGEPSKSLNLLRRCASHASAMGHSDKALMILEYARQHAHDTADLTGLLDEMLSAAKAAGRLDDVLAISLELRPMIRQHHSDSELFALEAEWLLKGTMDVEHLMQCLQASDATTHHKIEACLILQRYAHEFCDERLASRAYTAVKPLFPIAERQDRLQVELIYHTTFGNSVLGLQAISELSALMETMSNVGGQLRTARNIVVGLLAFGRPTEAMAAAEYHSRRAAELGLVTRQYEFEAVVGACHLASEEFANAEQRFAKLGPPPNAYLASLYNMLGIELALWSRDKETAQRLYQELELREPAQLPRNRGYLGGVELRLKQMDPEFVCSDAEFQAFVDVYERTKRFLSEDGLAQALAEDLRRRNAPLKGLQLLNDYVANGRRQCGILTPSFNNLKAKLEADAASVAA